MRFPIDYIQCLIDNKNDTDIKIGPLVDDWCSDCLKKWMDVESTFSNPYIQLGRTDWLAPFKITVKMISEIYVNDKLLNMPQVSNVLSQVESIYNSAINMRSTVLCYLDDLPYSFPSIRCQCAFSLALPIVCLLDVVHQQSIGALDINQYKVNDPFMLQTQDDMTLTIVGKCADVISSTNKLIISAFDTSSQTLSKFPSSDAIRMSRAVLLASSSYLTWLGSDIKAKYPQNG